MRSVTERNFVQTAIRGVEPTVVLFGVESPDCTVSERLLDNLSANLGVAARFVYVQADQEPQLASRYGVVRFPSLVLMRSGIVWWRYQGRLDSRAIAKLHERITGSRPSSARRRTSGAAPPKKLSRVRRIAKRLIGRDPLLPAAPAPAKARPGPEREFELNVVLPLLGRWNVDYREQLHCKIQSKHSRGLIDIMIYRAGGKRQVTLFENKARIQSDASLARAVKQANLYARARRLRSFVVAAPEGLWVYSRPDGKPRLERKFSPAEVAAGAFEAKELVIRLGQRQRRLTGISAVQTPRD